MDKLVSDGGCLADDGVGLLHRSTELNAKSVCTMCCIGSSMDIYFKRREEQVKKSEEA